MKHKNHNTLEPTTFRSTTLTHPGTEEPFPLELTQADWLGFSTKLDEAIRTKTNSTHLSRGERQRFSVNCELIRRVSIAIEARNYAMLEIHEAKQWRTDFRTITELAQSFDLSKSQFHKSVTSARINIEMAKAGIYHLRPKGRHLELVAGRKIGPQHRVKAWQYALSMADKKGNSGKVIERALEDYVERIKGNQDAKDDVFGKIPLVSPAKENANSEAKDGDMACDGSNAIAQIPWINSLNLEEEEIYFRFMKLETFFTTSSDPQMSRGRCMANELVEAALEHSVLSRDAGNALDAIRLAAKKDPRIKPALYHLGLHLISQSMNQRYSEGHPL